jgi:hypothetical protein
MKRNNVPPEKGEVRWGLVEVTANGGTTYMLNMKSGEEEVRLREKWQAQKNLHPRNRAAKIESIPRQL